MLFDCVDHFIHECGGLKGMFSRVVKDTMARYIGWEGLIDIESVVCVRTFILTMKCDLGKGKMEKDISSSFQKA